MVCASVGMISGDYSRCWIDCRKILGSIVVRSCSMSSIQMWCFCFIKQKTAYEVRISDGSSDVCSSDLASIVWFSAAALVAMIVLTAVGSWYRRNRHLAKPKPRKAAAGEPGVLTRGRVLFAIVVLVALLFSKNVYSASLSSYYTFYLMSKFGLSRSEEHTSELQ